MTFPALKGHNTRYALEQDVCSEYFPLKNGELKISDADLKALWRGYQSTYSGLQIVHSPSIDTQSSGGRAYSLSSGATGVSISQCSFVSRLSPRSLALMHKSR